MAAKRHVSLITDTVFNSGPESDTQESGTAFKTLTARIRTRGRWRNTGVRRSNQCEGQALGVALGE